MVGRASAQPRLPSTPYEKANARLLVQLPPSARKHRVLAVTGLTSTEILILEN